MTLDTPSKRLWKQLEDNFHRCVLQLHSLTCICAYIVCLPSYYYGWNICAFNQGQHFHLWVRSLLFSLTQVLHFWNYFIFLHHRIFPPYWIILISKDVVISPILKQYSLSPYKPLPLPPTLFIFSFIVKLRASCFHYLLQFPLS